MELVTLRNSQKYETHGASKKQGMTDRDLFFAIGDRHFVKRSQDDRYHEIQ